jgi:hypothetical protein
MTFLVLSGITIPVTKDTSKNAGLAQLGKDPINLGIPTTSDEIDKYDKELDNELWSNAKRL